jgi:hypothetical protein
MEDVTGGKPFESWNDRLRKGTATVPGGLEDWRKLAHPQGTRG